MGWFVKRMHPSDHMTLRGLSSGAWLVYPRHFAPDFLIKKKKKEPVAPICSYSRRRLFDFLARFLKEHILYIPAKSFRGYAKEITGCWRSTWYGIIDRDFPERNQILASYTLWQLVLFVRASCLPRRAERDRGDFFSRRIHFKVREFMQEATVGAKEILAYVEIRGRHNTCTTSRSILAKKREWICIPFI